MKKVNLEVLSSPGCHNCKEFENFWHSVEAKYPNVEYSHKSILDPEGMEMARKYSILASPGIIINSELFSVGGIDKNKFIKRIEELGSS